METAGAPATRVDVVGREALSGALFSTRLRTEERKHGWLVAEDPLGGSAHGLSWTTSRDTQGVWEKGRPRPFLIILIKTTSVSIFIKF